MKTETFNKAMVLSNSITAIERELMKFENSTDEKDEFLSAADLKLIFYNRSEKGGDFSSSKPTYKDNFPIELLEKINDTVDAAAQRIRFELKKHKEKLEKEFAKLND